LVVCEGAGAGANQDASTGSRVAAATSIPAVDMSATSIVIARSALVASRSVLP
jgi:hypothetical protein